MGLTQKRLADNKGFTLIELIVVSAILGVLATMSLPAYSDYVKKVKVTRAVGELRALEKDITSYYLEKNAYPDSLNDINRGTLKDPWGHTYQYLKIAAAGDGRQDIAMDLNTDYDLFSVGQDGVSAKSVGDPLSRDDILRVYDGTSVVHVESTF